MRTLSVFVASITVCASGCSLIDPPEPPPAVGTFAVTGELQMNSCGFAAMPMPTSYEVNAELAGLPGGEATWRWESNGSTVTGSASAGGTYRFVTARQMVMIAADPFYEIPGCTLEERSEVVVEVDPVPQATDGGVAEPTDADGGVVTRSLEGTYTVDIYPVAGSDCRALLGANGGNFQAMPCQAKSTLEGETAP